MLSHILLREYSLVELTRIYQCFCDLTRLRIMNLLIQGPLCVCHFQTLLDETQVKISKHLSYLRDAGLVEATRHQNWMIYSLPQERPAELEKNLACLQDCAQSEPLFKKDLRALKAIKSDVQWIGSVLDCCPEEEICGGGRAKKKGKACR